MAVADVVENSPLGGGAGDICDDASLAHAQSATNLANGRIALKPLMGLERDGYRELGAAIGC